MSPRLLVSWLLVIAGVLLLVLVVWRGWYLLMVPGLLLAVATLGSRSPPAGGADDAQLPVFLKRDLIVLADFLIDVWAINLAVSKRLCRLAGGTPVVSDAAVVCLGVNAPRARHDGRPR